MDMIVNLPEALIYSITRTVLIILNMAVILNCVAFSVCDKFNALTPNDLLRCRAVSPLKIKISSKNMREKPANTPIIHPVY
jgi:hypothetical protein